MNRRDRRASAKQEGARQEMNPTGYNLNNYNPNTGVSGTAPVVAAPASSSFLLRLVARLLLSRWIIKRVQHPHVLMSLSHMAGQAGRMDAMMYIQEKLRRQTK